MDRAGEAIRENSLIRPVCLLHRPPVAIGVGEEDEAAPGEILHLRYLHPAPGQRLARLNDVVDDQLQASSEPGAISVRPRPMEIEHAEPGGVSWTKRISSLTA